MLRKQNKEEDMKLGVISGRKISKPEIRRRQETAHQLWARGMPSVPLLSYDVFKTVCHKVRKENLFIYRKRKV